MTWIRSWHDIGWSMRGLTSEVDYETYFRREVWPTLQKSEYFVDQVKDQVITSWITIIRLIEYNHKMFEEYIPTFNQ